MLPISELLTYVPWYDVSLILAGLIYAAIDFISYHAKSRKK